MKNKKVKTMLSAAAMMIAAGSGIFCAWKAGRKKKTEDTEIKEPVFDEEGLAEEKLTEEKLRECLLRLFGLYEDSEFDDLVEFLGDGSDPREYAAENYAAQIFPYIKKNMKDVMMLAGDDGTGKEPFYMTDELFYYPACIIGSRIRELYTDRFALCRESEIWILENGEFASVYSISLRKGGGRLTYRFLDTYISEPGDIPICFDDLESGFSQIIEAEEEGRVAELP